MKDDSNLLRKFRDFFCLLFLSLAVPTVCFADALYWESKAPMPTARSQAHSAVVNGKLYVLGGQTGEGVPPSGILSTVERYDPGSDSWESMPPLSIPRVIGCSVTQGNYIYIIGGGSDAGPGYGPPISTTVLRYETTSGTSTVIGNINHARMRSGCEIVDNKIYVVGGADGPGPPGFSYALDTMEVFDLNTNTVTETVTLPAKRDLPTTAIVGTKLYIFGGFVDGYTLDWNTQKVYAEKTCWVYDTVTKTFTTKNPMLIGMGSRISTVLPDGKIYLNGGLAISPPSVSNVNTVAQIYNPATDSWTVRSGEPVSATGFSPAAGVINNRIYVVGGNNNNGVVINTNRSGIFQPATDTELTFTASSGVTAAGVTLSSSTGLSSGKLAVSVASGGIGPTPYGIASQYYDLATSADFTGNLSVTIPYNMAWVTGNESSLKLYHWNGSAWENITTSVDPVNKTITGTTSSLSPFVVGGSAGVDSVTITTLTPGALATASLTGTTLNLGIPQGQTGVTGPQGPQGPAGSPDTQSQILGKIAAAADSTVLSMQQGSTEAGSAVKLAVKDTAGNNKFSVQANGAVGIGTSTPTYPLTIDSGIATAVPAGVGMAMLSGNSNKERMEIRSFGPVATSAPVIQGKGAQWLNGVPTSTLQDQFLIMLGGSGYDNTGAMVIANRGMVTIKSEENWTPAAQGTYVSIQTTQPGSTNRTEKVRITGSGNVGIGITAPTQKLEINGGIRINTTAARPACDSTTRGTYWITQGGSGVKDVLDVCLKDAADGYAWRSIW